MCHTPESMKKIVLTSMLSMSVLSINIFAAGTGKSGEACPHRDFMTPSPVEGELAACQSRASNGNQSVKGEGENPSGKCGRGLTTGGTSFNCGATAIGEEAKE